MLKCLSIPIKTPHFFSDQTAPFWCFHKRRTISEILPSLDAFHEILKMIDKPIKLLLLIKSWLNHGFYKGPGNGQFWVATIMILLAWFDSLEGSFLIPNSCWKRFCPPGKNVNETTESWTFDVRETIAWVGWLHKNHKILRCCTNVSSSPTKCNGTYQQLPPFGIAVCLEICPWTLSVQRRDSFFRV